MTVFDFIFWVQNKEINDWAMQSCKDAYKKALEDEKE